MTAVVVRSDSRTLPLADESIDLVVTSPPYFGLRSYTDGGRHYEGQVGAEGTPAEFVDALLDVTRECMRVLKPSGSLWVNLGDKYGRDGGVGTSRSLPGAGRGTEGQRPAYGRAAWNRDKSLLGLPWRYALACTDQLELTLRAEVIWSKPNGLPESVTDRVRRSHEQWFHFTLQPRYFSAMDAVREGYAPASNDRAAYGFETAMRGRALGSPVDKREAATPGWQPSPLGKLPSSVWTIPTQPLKVPAELGVDHFAAFPTEWPRRIILGWSPPDGVVLDPFGGTGTTALVASALGRTGVTVDLSEDYCRLARWRTRDAAQLAKVRGEPFRSEPAQHPGQDDLFAVEGGAA